MGELRCLLLVGLLSVAGGCAWSEDPSPRTGRAEPLFFTEYQRLYHVVVDGTQKDRVHVGFVEKRSTEDDPDGTRFILDAKRERRGFVTSWGGAYAFVVENGELTESRSLGNIGFNLGVQRILGTAGYTFELDPITAD